MKGLDLTPEEQDHVRLALRFLHRRAGGWRVLSHAIGFARHSLTKVRGGEKGVSPRMLIRVAKLAGVPVDDILTGKFPPQGTCPNCGHYAKVGGNSDI